MNEDFSYFQTLLISITTSVIFFTGILVFMLSGGLEFAFSRIYIPIYVLALTGAVLGIIHGLIMGLILIWRNPDSSSGVLIASILAMEFISLIVCGYLWLLSKINDHSPKIESKSFSDYAYFFIGGIIIFLIVSFLLLVPAIIIGFINRFFLNYFR